MLSIKTLSQNELNTIEKLFQLHQMSVIKVMGDYLKSRYDNVIATKDYIIAVGDIPVALVAHADTVFKSPPERIFYDREKNVMISPDGLGADDRAGIFAIIMILKSGFRPTVIITTDEEKGGLGADTLVRHMKNPPTDLKYIIQLDRSGSNDCVFYNCDNKDFENYVEDFGFVTDFGTFSDISVICPRWKIAGVNLSIGYHDEHTKSETLYIGQLFSTINKVRLMLKDIANADHFEYIPSKKRNWWSYGIDYSYDYPSENDFSQEQWEQYMTTRRKCDLCGEYDYEYNLFPVKTKLGKTSFVCMDCIAEKPMVQWCDECGEAFLDEKENNLCVDCREKLKNVPKRKK